jgi:hypothetical protein
MQNGKRVIGHDSPPIVTGYTLGKMLTLDREKKA